jgi:hypothetical protein
MFNGPTDHHWRLHNLMTTSFGTSMISSCKLEQLAMNHRQAYTSLRHGESYFAPFF